MKTIIIVIAALLLAGTAWGQTGITDTARTEYKWDEAEQAFSRVITYPAVELQADLERRLAGLQAERAVLLSLRKKALTEAELREALSFRDRDTPYDEQLDARIAGHEALILRIENALRQAPGRSE